MNLVYKTIFGKIVRAEPLEPGHYEGLKIAASDPRIWRYMLIPDGYDEGFDPWLEGMVAKQKKGEIYPYTIIKQDNNEVIGYCIFLNISIPFESLDYGCVWYNPKYWGQRKNKYTVEGTYLFQQLAFEVMGVRRWVLRTEAENKASNKANIAMGATFEGIMRQDKLVRGTVWRNTAIYSILKDEWPANKKRFVENLGYEIPVSEMLENPKIEA